MRLIDADELLRHIPPEEMIARWTIESAPTITPDMAQVLAYESGKASSENIVATFEEECATECPICRFSIEGGPCKLIRKLLGVDMRGDKE